MNKENKDSFIPHDPSRGLTRDPAVVLEQGSTAVKKLPVQMFCYNKNIEKLKKYNKCCNKKCLTCPFAHRDQIDDNSEKIFCKSTNIIYAIECKVCGLIYVGQTGIFLNKRINNHRSVIRNYNKHGKQEIEILHFQKHSFEEVNFLILKEVEDLNERLDLENIFICKLKSLHPYGLNSKLNGEGVLDLNSSCIYGKFNVFGNFSNVSNFRGSRGKGKNNSRLMDIDKLNTFCDFSVNSINIKTMKNFIFNSKNSALKWFFRTKWSVFKFASDDVRDIFIDLVKFKLKILDISNISQKILLKEFCVIRFLDKVYEDAAISRVFHECQYFFPIKDQVRPSVCFKYNQTIKKLICNYNFHSQNLDSIEEDNCFCKLDKYKDFVNDDYGHIITGNLDIVENIDLRKLMALGSKFRTRKFVDVKLILFSIGKDLDYFIAKCSRKYNWPVEGFREWKSIVLNSISYNCKNHSSFYKGVFLTKSIRNEINNIKNLFVIAVIDKATNNFCFICKSFFKNLMLQEYKNNETYIKIDNPKKEIDSRILAFSKKIQVKLSKLIYPYLFPTVKFHKAPIKFRFVTCCTSSYSSTFGKKLFSFLKIILSKIFRKEKHFIINNNRKPIEFLNNNPANTIHTFDFENLFTSIPHNNLLEICSILFDDYLTEENTSKKEWLELCRANIFENYLFNGNSFYKQVKGIPMGNSFSSAFADLFLHFYERQFLKVNFLQGFRYIDDLLVLDLQDSEVLFKIYPVGLKLIRTNSSNSAANFLDLSIRISNRELFIGLYDKRKDFDFNVLTLSNFNTNLNHRIFYNIFHNQFSRIKYICNNKVDFLNAIERFESCLRNNNFPFNFCNFQFLKNESLCKFS